MKSLRPAGIAALSSILLCACSSWTMDHCPSLVESDGTLDLPQVQAALGGDMPEAIAGPVYQTARQPASRQAIDADAYQRTACQAIQRRRPGLERDEKQAVLTNAQLNVYAEGLKGNLKPGATAAAAVVQPPAVSAVSPSGWYGFILSSNKSREAELQSRVGNFSRLPGNGTFTQLCSSVGLTCNKVVDWEGNRQSCDENPNDGRRLAYCQSRF